MHDSMMIADVGGIENVSGRRIATPLAPPRPGSTPMSTPSRMPRSMKPRFFQARATAKPCIRLPMSSNRSPVLRFLLVRGSLDSFLVAQHALEGSLRQRYEEPDFEQRE